MDRRLITQCLIILEIIKSSAHVVQKHMRWLLPSPSRILLLDYSATTTLTVVQCAFVMRTTKLLGISVDLKLESISKIHLQRKNQCDAIVASVLVPTGGKLMLFNEVHLLIILLKNERLIVVIICFSLAHRSGLFYEDEYEITTSTLAPLVLPNDDWYERKKQSFLLLDPKYTNTVALGSDRDLTAVSNIVDSVPPFLLEMLKEQCLLLFGSSTASRFTGEVVSNG